MSVERSGLTVRSSSDNTGGRGEMIKAPIWLQDLRRRIYAKAKAEPSWRFWGLMRARKRRGFGWTRWSRRLLYENLGLFQDYRVRRFMPPKALPNR